MHVKHLHSDSDSDLFKYFDQFYCMINFQSKIMNDVLVSLSFLSRFTFCKVKWQHFKGVMESVT